MDPETPIEKWKSGVHIYIYKLNYKNSVEKPHFCFKTKGLQKKKAKLTHGISWF